MLFRIKGKENKSIPVNGITRIPVGTVLSAASLVSVADIRIDGVVNGPVMCEGKVVIGAEGVVAGDLICCNADISGTLTGNITASNLVNITSTGRLRGDIRSGVLGVENGATFEGNCSIITEEEFSAAAEELRRRLENI